MRLMRVEITKVEDLGNDKFRLETQEGSVFFAKGVKPEVGHVQIEYHENTQGRYVIDKVIPMKSPEAVPPEQPLQLSDGIESGARKIEASSILRAIWMSPALGTQPGNPEEIAKIAKKWYEESLKWLQ